MSKNYTFHWKTKHIDMRYHWIRMFSKMSCLKLRKSIPIAIVWICWQRHYQIWSLKYVVILWIHPHNLKEGDLLGEFLPKWKGIFVLSSREWKRSLRCLFCCVLCCTKGVREEKKSHLLLSSCEDISFGQIGGLRMICYWIELKFCWRVCDVQNFILNGVGLVSSFQSTKIYNTFRKLGDISLFSSCV